MERSRQIVAITGEVYGVKGGLGRFFFQMGYYRIYLILMGLFPPSGSEYKEGTGKVEGLQSRSKD